MIRRVLIGCLGLAFALALAACGGDTKQPKVDASKVGAAGPTEETKGTGAQFKAE